MRPKNDLLIIALIAYLLLQIVALVYLLSLNNAEAAAPKSLYDAAMIKMGDLVNTNHWAHTNSNGCDLPCRLSGIPYMAGHENLYHGKCNLQTAIVAWQNSPKHQEVLNTDFDQLVLIAEKGEDGKCYIVYNSINY